MKNAWLLSVYVTKFEIAAYMAHALYFVTIGGSLQNLNTYLSFFKVHKICKFENHVTRNEVINNGDITKNNRKMWP